ncbi:hypothetical protein SAMN05444365_1011049 [Micromonospora pattaloongensis]|uniref:Uncharacterized protein n=2 Tax=Micromonospora pattaloongensis TaxID=405436 RepID=A0A1H3HZ32_9ACTN|nr:hypothetical protein SAMN05444365_1011049 [Micromonospora pattaloongensis]
MTMGSENLTNGSATQDRFGSQYRGSRRDALNGDTADDLAPRNGSAAARASSDRPALPSLDSGLKEPVFPPAGWLDASGGASLADHPVLRGLLMELPPKGNAPSAEWLDRWFEAARSILELLYAQDMTRGR